MNPHSYTDVREAFDRAMSLPCQEREVYLHEIARDSPALRGEVESLIRHADEIPDSVGRALRPMIDKVVDDMSHGKPEGENVIKVRVRHLARSSRAGETQTFKAGVIRIGRRPDNDIAFNPERDLSVSGHHAEIRVSRRGPRIQLQLADLGSRNGTYVNGSPVKDIVELKPADRITLGKDGPELAVEIQTPGRDGVAATILAPRRARQAPTLETDDLRVSPFGAGRSGTSTEAPAARGRTRPRDRREDGPRRSARARPGGAGDERRNVGVNTLMNAIDTATRKERRRGLVTISAALGAFAILLTGWLATRPAPPLEAVPEAVIARASESVYLVITQTNSGKLLGTAWSLQPGLLATNAHVAAPFLELEKGEEMIVRSASSPPQDFRVVGVKIHPGYEAFGELSRMYMPREGYIPPFDVAVLEIEPIDGAVQAPPLKLYPGARITGLAVGQPITLIGFPAEDLAGTSLEHPAAMVKSTEIGRVSNIFKESGTLSEPSIVSYNLTNAGGASGSPVIDAQGRVIGVHSAGDKVHLGGHRIGVGGMSHGQRVDMLAELLDDSAFALMESRRNAWDEKFKAMFAASVADPQRLGFEVASALVKEERIRDARIEVVGAPRRLKLPADEELLQIPLELDQPGIYVATLVVTDAPVRFMVSQFTEGQNEGEQRSSLGNTSIQILPVKQQTRGMLLALVDRHEPGAREATLVLHRITN